MTCYRDYKDCEEMEAMVHSGCTDVCFCMGVVAPESRDSPAHSKRLCLIDGGELDIQIDFMDEELLAIQCVIANGMLNVLQRASLMRKDNV